MKKNDKNVENTDNVNTDTNPKDSFTVLRIVISTVVLFIGIVVALSPGVFYAPVPRVVLYLLIALLPAILFGAEAAAKFELNFKAFSFTTVGAAAITFAMLFVLTHLSKPEQQIAVFHIYDERQQPVMWLARNDAVRIPLTKHGIQVTKFIDENTIVLIFPEQVDECEIQVKPTSAGATYSGTLRYTGNRETKLFFGKHLKTTSSSN